jgi:hypothetical protein
MNWADVLSIVAIIVSFVTFAITTYEQYLKSAKLQLILGKDIALSYGPQFSYLTLWASVSLVNQGALDAVVLRISGQLTDHQSVTVPVEWQALCDFEMVDKKKGSQPQFMFKDWTEALIASSRKAATSWISFNTDRSANAESPRLKPDTVYSLQLDVYVPMTRWSLLGSFNKRSTSDHLAASWAGSFQLPGDGINYLEKHCIADDTGWVKDYVTVQWTGASRGWTVPITLASSSTSSVKDQ